METTTKISAIPTELELESRLRLAGWLMVGLGFLAALVR